MAYDFFQKLTKRILAIKVLSQKSFFASGISPFLILNNNNND